MGGRVGGGVGRQAVREGRKGKEEGGGRLKEDGGSKGGKACSEARDEGRGRGKD